MARLRGVPRDAPARVAVRARPAPHLGGARAATCVFDNLFLHRANPIGARYHDYGTLGTVFGEPASDHDVEAILGAVRRHEGEASARIACHWLQRHPHGFHVVRGAGGGLLGFVGTVALHDSSTEDEEVDPAVRAAWGFARSRGPLRSGEEMLHHRFHIACDSYQDVSPIINLLAMMVTVAPMQHARLAWSFITFADIDRWRPIMRYINFEPADEAAFVVGG